jgi:hypothetical protein
MHSNLVLTLVVLTSISEASASPFHRVSLVSPSLKALHLRGGNIVGDEAAAVPEMGDVDAQLDAPTLTGIFGEEATVGEINIEEMIVEPPAGEPTMQRLSSIMKAYRQPASPDIVESLLDDEVVPAPDLNPTDGTMAMLATTVAGLKTAVLDALVAYPVLKYVLAAVAALVVITIVKGLFSNDAEVAEPTPQTVISFKAVDPVVLTQSSKPKYISASLTHVKKNAGNPQIMASVLLGGLGMLAGSLAMLAESAESGLTNVASTKGKSGAANGECMSDLSCDDVKKVGAGAAGGALASGIIGRSVVIGKVLSVMF